MATNKNLTTKEGIKKITKDGAAVGGVSLSYLLVLFAQSQGIPISEAEVVLLTGVLGGIGNKIRDIFKD